jgi:uncharacterized protein YqhQ
LTKNFKFDKNITDKEEKMNKEEKRIEATQRIYARIAIFFGVIIVLLITLGVLEVISLTAAILCPFFLGLICSVCIIGIRELNKELNYILAKRKPHTPNPDKKE